MIYFDGKEIMDAFNDSNAIINVNLFKNVSERDFLKFINEAKSYDEILNDDRFDISLIKLDKDISINDITVSDEQGKKNPFCFGKKFSYQDYLTREVKKEERSKTFKAYEYFRTEQPLPPELNNFKFKSVKKITDVPFETFKKLVFSSYGITDTIYNYAKGNISECLNLVEQQKKLLLFNNSDYDKLKNISISKYNPLLQEEQWRLFEELSLAEKKFIFETEFSPEHEANAITNYKYSPIYLLNLIAKVKKNNQSILNIPTLTRTIENLGVNKVKQEDILKVLNEEPLLLTQKSDSESDLYKNINNVIIEAFKNVGINRTPRVTNDIITSLISTGFNENMIKTYATDLAKTFNVNQFTKFVQYNNVNGYLLYPYIRDFSDLKIKWLLSEVSPRDISVLIKNHQNNPQNSFITFMANKDSSLDMCREFLDIGLRDNMAVLSAKNDTSDDYERLLDNPITKDRREYGKQERLRYFSDPTVPTEDWCLSFQGKNTIVEKDGYQMFFLKPDDDLLFAVGNITHCCQHLQGAADTCVRKYAQEPFHGVAVITKNGKIVGQGYMWSDEEKGFIVADNMEFANDADFNQYKGVIEEFAKALPYKEFHIGLSYNPNCSGLGKRLPLNEKDRAKQVDLFLPHSNIYSDYIGHPAICLTYPDSEKEYARQRNAHLSNSIKETPEIDKLREEGRLNALDFNYVAKSYFKRNEKAKENLIKADSLEEILKINAPFDAVCGIKEELNPTVFDEYLDFWLKESILHYNSDIQNKIFLISPIKVLENAIHNTNYNDSIITSEKYMLLSPELQKKVTEYFISFSSEDSKDSNRRNLIIGLLMFRGFKMLCNNIDDISVKDFDFLCKNISEYSRNNGYSMVFKLFNTEATLLLRNHPEYAKAFIDNKINDITYTRALQIYIKENPNAKLDVVEYDAIATTVKTEPYRYSSTFFNKIFEDVNESNTLLSIVENLPEETIEGLNLNENLLKEIGQNSSNQNIQFCYSFFKKLPIDQIKVILENTSENSELLNGLPILLIRHRPDFITLSSDVQKTILNNISNNSDLKSIDDAIIEGKSKYTALKDIARYIEKESGANEAFIASLLFNTDLDKKYIKETFDKKKKDLAVIEDTEEISFTKSENIKNNDCDGKCGGCIKNIICNEEVKESIETNFIANSHHGGKVVNLSSAQQLIVNDNSKGSRVVNAGPGAGKTTVLPHRIRRQISNGANVNDFLLLSFTRVGAKELASRTMSLLGSEGILTDADKFNSGTVNSFAYSVIRKYYKEAGFDKKPTVMADAFLKTRVLQNIINKKFGTGTRITVDNYKSQMGGEIIMAEFEKWKKQKNYIEIEDQVPLARDVLNNRPEIWNELGVKHLIIDEFQDSNEDQIQLFQSFIRSSGYETFTCVGDESQSIFSFMNTSPKYIQEFEKYFKRSKKFDLMENRRSRKPIIDMANSISSKHLTNEPIISVREGTGSEGLLYKEYNSVASELKDIAKASSELWKRGEKSVAIIVNNAKEIQKVSTLLDGYGVPNKKVCPLPYYENDRVKTLVSYFYNYINNSLEGAIRYENIINHSELQKMSVSELEKHFDEVLKRKPENPSIEDFMERVEKLDVNENDAVYQAFLEIVEQTGSIDSLKEFLDDFIKAPDTLLYTDKSEAEAITITTLHSSKGLEWKNVFCSISNLTCEKKYEKEYYRKLYTAVTRAKDNLAITITPSKSSVSNFIQTDTVRGTMLMRQVRDELNIPACKGHLVDNFNRFIDISSKKAKKDNDEIKLATENVTSFLL